MKKAVIILFVMALAALTLAFAGCGGDGGSSDTPDQVVEKFMTAAMEGNANAAYELISEDSKSELGDKESLVAGFSESVTAYEVGAATISGDRARVPVSYQMQGFGELVFDTILVKENGAWKISLNDTNVEAQKALEELMQQSDTGE
jgi:hypothetical protein